MIQSGDDTMVARPKEDGGIHFYIGRCTALTVRGARCGKRDGGMGREGEGEQVRAPSTPLGPLCLQTSDSSLTAPRSPQSTPREKGHRWAKEDAVAASHHASWQDMLTRKKRKHGKTGESRDIQRLPCPVCRAGTPRPPRAGRKRVVVAARHAATVLFFKTLSKHTGRGRAKQTRLVSL